jgi:hypothetical protein
MGAKVAGAGSDEIILRVLKVLKELNTQYQLIELKLAHILLLLLLQMAI